MNYPVGTGWAWGPVPYPTHLFPGPVYQAINEVIRHTQAPGALVAMAALGTMAISLQGILDVELPIGKLSPVSLYLLTKAESGERKSVVDALFTRTIHESDAAHEVAYENAMGEHAAEMRAWCAIEKGYLSKIRRRIERDEDVDDVQAQLETHVLSKPVKPRRRPTLCGNITSKALLERLDGEGASLAFLASEGGVFTKGGALTQIELLNDCWSGVQSLAVDRADGEHRVMRNPRVTISCMIQEAVLREYEERHGHVARGSGHWARYLVVDPMSTQGTRFLYSTDPVWEHLPVFQERVRAFLDHHGHRMRSGNSERMALSFSADAKVRWRDMANWVEGQLAPGGELADIRDFASKMMEIVGRLAALLHCYTLTTQRVVVGELEEISVDTVNSAMTIAEYHMHEFKRMFAPQSLITQLHIDAQALEDKLRRDVWAGGYTCLRKNVLLQYGPLRKKERLDPAIDALAAMGRIWIGVGPNREKYVNLNPNYFAGSSGR